MSPQIPGMPTPPKPDAGAGGHGSQPIYSRADDLAFFYAASKAQALADAAGLTHAAAGMRHYLDNSGSDFTIEPDAAMTDVANLKSHADLVISERIGDLARDPSNHNKTVAFTTPWHGTSVGQSENQDWFLAMGSVEVCATGVVTISPAAGGGQSHIAMDYQVHFFDRYNWDGKKFVVILGVKITDQRMGGLHTAGLAKEFNQFGTSSTKHFEGMLPAYGSIDLPSPDGGRGGSRTDPTR
ncbi:hypothetical protein [Nocardia bovistercoris]|uniref:Uncharacterized protein n=1 Tax=Nocardia bovistercoris TaxID=2785916 RepID=A0A931I6W0_9NOCA|nr:hypothetical protein [Nocardia bovistercoris]MBH0776022.1 hypothetical protein [Nocardia bovistercoris]